MAHEPSNLSGFFKTPARAGAALVLACLLLAPGALWAQAAPGEPSAPPAWADASKAGETFRRSVKRYNLQTEKGGPAPPRQRFLAKIPREPFIVMAVATAVILLYLLFKAIVGAIKAAPKKDPGVKAADGDIDTKALIDTGLKADDLAGQGRIVEAMHLLLLETIEELKKRANVALPSSFTSREIVDSLNLAPAATQSLGQIVGAVEPTWFGGLRPDMDQYRGLRDTFDGFLAILSGATTKP
ncbi:MAG: DUF4129 domain-containing protein [Deltaproteobacteria bacterium]|jgi:hypothetical protein|nr:DUF4129 domain-containing protein [Deltaproteobacteria bacterium]